MNNIPTTGELFATNQVYPDTERCYKYQLRNFADWMADSRDVHDMEAVSTADLLAYRQSIQHLAASSQNRYLTAMSQTLFELIEHNNIHLYASVELRNHAAHCVAVESTRG
jgi:hypothetical protein